MQPIHIATCNGHLNVVSALVERFGVNPQETTNVCMYVCIMLMHSHACVGMCSYYNYYIATYIHTYIIL